VFFDKKHPLADKGGRVYLHRHLASIKIGRWLSKEDHVHHVDENKLNNSPDNLQVLSNSDHVKIHSRPKKFVACKTCGGPVPSGRKVNCSKKCANISFESRRKIVIDKSVLEKLVWEEPMVSVAKKLNVSDVAIKKKCKSLGIKTPPIGYWNNK
jgi:endogenous inhibitor of DNA gyrase (YacG/DUF329 family)